MKFVAISWVVVGLLLVWGGAARADDDVRERTPTRDLVVRLKPGTGPLEFASAHGLRYVGAVMKDVSPDLYLFRAKKPQNVAGNAMKRLVQKLEAHSGVEWVEPQVASWRHTRSDLTKRITDPKFEEQWHLEGDPGVSLNVKAALKQGIDGSGVTIAIVDDGVQMAHPDLRDRMARKLCWDFNDQRKTDCSPFPTDGHGTAAAGMAAAGRNAACGIGTASGAKIAGLRLIAGPITDVTEATALSYKRDEIDIYSNSWGPVDDGMQFSGAGRLTRLTLASGATEGRKGKGNIFVWAAGNGRQHRDNCNRDSYANSRHTIAVGAIDHRGRTAYYSEPCAELMVVVPSSGAGKGLVTTDLRGSSGYSSGDCTDRFGGTSGAAPQVAGVVAGILQARPDLTKRDVEGVLAKSAVRVNPSQGGWSHNARGYTHHHDYGFGRIDYARTLRIAQEWNRMPAQKFCQVPLKGINRKIPFAMSRRGALEVPLDITGACGIEFVEHVEVKAFLAHSRRGTVVVSITDPEGITSVLADANNDYNRDYPLGGWTFGSVRHWGGRAKGRWTYSLYDTSTSYGQGVAEWVQLTIYGH